MTPHNAVEAVLAALPYARPGAQVGCTAYDLVTSLGYSDTSIYRALTTLQARNQVGASGPKRGRRYWRWP